MSPQETLEDAGYPPNTFSKVLPDGRIAWIHQLIFTYAILVSSPETIREMYQDRWCFTTRHEADTALKNWTDQPEPTGWIRHPASGRRRPNGDSTKEYVNL